MFFLQRDVSSVIVSKMAIILRYATCCCDQGVSTQSVNTDAVADGNSLQSQMRDEREEVT